MSDILEVLEVRRAISDSFIKLKKYLPDTKEQDNYIRNAIFPIVGSGGTGACRDIGKLVRAYFRIEEDLLWWETKENIKPVETVSQEEYLEIIGEAL